MKKLCHKVLSGSKKTCKEKDRQKEGGEMGRGQAGKK